MIGQLAGWAAKVTVGICLGLIVRFFWPSSSDASHPFPYTPVDTNGDTIVDTVHSHLRSITSLEPEVFCAKSHNPGTLTDGELLSLLTNTLIYANPSSDGYRWTGIGGGRVSFVPMVLPNCGYGVEERIFYRASTSGCTDPRGRPASCFTGFFGNQYNPLTGHRERTSSEILFYIPGLTGSTSQRHFSINHETGHALGLCDGGETAPAPQGGCELNPYHFECTDSVMHPYGCPDFVWPTVWDVYSVVSLMPVGSDGGGGGGSRGCPFALPC
jgi:hypothetical protein